MSVLDAGAGAPPRPASRPPADDLPPLSPVMLPTVIVPLAEAAVAEDWPERALGGEAPHELIVAASERTPAEVLARLRRRGCLVQQSDAPRGVRLRRAASGARGSPLVFLHGDCRLPPGWRGQLDSAVAGRHPWGAFALRFEDAGGRGVLPLVALGANARTRLLGLPFGDQAPFATRAAYDAVGGHPPWGFLDDLELALRLRRLAPPLLLAPAVTTSARRYLHHGTLRTVLSNLSILIRFAWGANPAELATAYRSRA
jgi:hypothetical protein